MQNGGEDLTHLLLEHANDAHGRGMGPARALCHLKRRHYHGLLDLMAKKQNRNYEIKPFIDYFV